MLIRRVGHSVCVTFLSNIRFAFACKQVGIIGVGRIGRCHCASVASVPTKATVTMICDISEPALEEVSRIFHVPKTTKDPMEVGDESS